MAVCLWTVAANPILVLHVQHYSAVMKYISQGPMLIDVHMHRPHTNSRNFMDALLAFWPGLQVKIFLILLRMFSGDVIDTKSSNLCLQSSKICLLKYNFIILMEASENYIGLQTLYFDVPV